MSIFFVRGGLNKKFKKYFFYGGIGGRVGGGYLQI